jgi:hypothetical protein
MGTVISRFRACAALAAVSAWGGCRCRKRPGISFREEGFNCTLARELAPTLKRGAVKLSDEDRRQHLSSVRKAASAKIAKIPLALSSHIARVYRPKAAAA